MPRLQPAEPHGLDPIRRLTFQTALRMYGRELEPTRVIAHHRPLLLGLGAISIAGERFSKSVDEHLKNLARLRSAQLIGCEWCLDFGSYLAQKAGSSAEQLRELATWRDSRQFDAVERLVLEYTEAMTRTPVEVSDELFAALQDHFEERQIVELTMVVALENLYSRFNWAVGIEGEGFSDGMYSCDRRPMTESRWHRFKRRASRALERRLVNPLVRRAVFAGRMGSTYAVLETIGRRTGAVRRTPVANGLQDDTFWLISAHGPHAHYFRNLQAEPRVRVGLADHGTLRWRTGTAHPLLDDNARDRHRLLGRGRPGYRLDGVLLRSTATALTTVRIDLDPE